MRFHKIAVLGTVALTAFSLAACSSGSPAKTADAGPVTLKFQSLSDQPAAIEATKAIVASWNSANPDIKVDIIQAGWDGVYDKLVTQLSGGAAPDVIHYEAASIIPFAKDGYMADLTKFITPEMKADVSEGVWDSVTVEKKIIALPTQMQTYVVFANKKALDAAGVKLPTGDSMSWDTFMQIAKATTKSGQYGVAWGLKSPTATFMSLGMGFGGGYFTGTGKDAKIAIGEGEMAVPKRIHTMAYQDKSIEPLSLTQAGSKALATFYAGKAAMTVQGSFQAANIIKDAPAGFEWVELPPLAGSAGAAQAANPQTLSVNADSKSVEQAAQFASFFANAENQVKINLADALIPPSKKAQDQILKETGGKNGWTETLASAKELTSAPFLSVDAYTQWKDTIATPAYQKYLANRIDDAGLSKELTDGWAKVNR